MKACELVLTPGPWTQAQALDLGLKSTIMVPGVDTKLLDQAPDDVEKVDGQVLFISRLAPHKGLDKLILAMEGMDNVHLVVCGPGDVQPYEELATRLGVEADFGGPTDTEKLRLIKESAVLCHPSSYEGFGLPPLEALYLGTQVADIVLRKGRNLYINDRRRIEAMVANYRAAAN